MKTRKFIVLLIVCILLLILNLYIGSVGISPSDVTDILLGRINGRNGESEAAIFIILESRLPQALTALIAGAALSVCGLLLQTAFRNPLAGPSILGISSGASLGVALVMLLAGGFFSFNEYTVGGSGAIIVGALLGSMAVMGLLLYFSLKIKSNALLLIAGMMTGYLTSSVVTVLSSLSTAQGLQGYVAWGMGTFGGVPLERMVPFSMLSLLGMGMAVFLAKPLNLLLLGDNYARNLGVRVNRIRNLLLIASGLLTAVITAYCGPISFIGIAIPHIARLIFRTDDHFVLMPGVMVTGASACLLCNLGTVAIPDHVIPLNALTPIVGVPVILYVILRKNH